MFDNVIIKFDNVITMFDDVITKFDNVITKFDNVITKELIFHNNLSQDENKSRTNRKRIRCVSKTREAFM